MKKNKFVALAFLFTSSVFAKGGNPDGYCRAEKDGWNWFQYDKQFSSPCAGEFDYPSALGYIPLFTNNPTDNAMWVTIYDLGRTQHLDYGCVPAHAGRRWASGNYLRGSWYYIRAEVKENQDCGGETLYDTSIQMYPESVDNEKSFGKLDRINSLIATLQMHDGGYHWEKGADHAGPGTRQEPSTLHYGESFSIQNGYNNWNGGFLDTRNNCSDSESIFCVSTAYSPNRDSGSGRWIILSALGKKINEPVMADDLVYLANEFGGGFSQSPNIFYGMFGGFLDVKGEGCDDNMMCVSTAYSADRHQSSGTWRIRTAGEIPGPVKVGQAVRFLSWHAARGADVAGYLDTRGRGCSDNFLCVSTSWNETRDSGSTLWRLY
jgi:hypothetical protein